MPQKKRSWQPIKGRGDFLIGGLAALLFITAAIAVFRGSLYGPDFLGSLAGGRQGIPDVAEPSVEIFRTTSEGIITMPAKSMRPNWLGQNDAAFIMGGAERNYRLTLGSFARYYDMDMLQRYPFLIMAKQNPFTLMQNKGFLMALNGMGASGNSFCEVPQKEGGKVAGTGLFSLCNLDACNRQEGVKEEADEAAYERGRGLVSEDVGSSPLSSEEHDRRVAERYEASKAANRRVQEAERRVSGAERARDEAESNAEMGLATPAEVQTKNEELKNTEAELREAREADRAAKDDLEEAKNARAEAREQEREEERQTSESKKTGEEEGDGWDDEETACVDELGCGSPLRRAQRYLRYLTADDIARIMNTGYSDPPENAPESYIVPEHARPTALDVLGQPPGDGTVVTPGATAGAIDVCSGLYAFMTANMQVCDPAPEGGTPSCSRGFGAGAMQIPFGALMMMRQMR